MKSTKWWTASTLALVLLFAGVGASMASGMHGMGQGMGMGQGIDCQGTVEGDKAMNHALQRMTRVLTLTDDQQTKISEIMVQHHEQASKQHNGMQEVHTVMAAQKATFDEHAVREAAKASGAAHEEMMVSRAKMQSEIYAALTVEQQALYNKLEMTLCNGHDSGQQGGGMPHAGMMSGNMNHRL